MDGDKPITKHVDEVVTAVTLAPTVTAGSFDSLCFWVIVIYSQTTPMVSERAAKQRNSHLQRAFLGSAKHHYIPK